MNYLLSGIAGGAAFSFLTGFNRFFGLVQKWVTDKVPI
jgi:hypothetical protein